MSHEVVPPVEDTVPTGGAGEAAPPPEGAAAGSRPPAAPAEASPALENELAATDASPATGGASFDLASAPTGRRVRARLARFNAPWQSSQVSEVLEPLISCHREHHPKADVRLLQRAFDMAARWHTGQYRKSGDPYITHPLAVATILANLGMDTTTLVAALLHDTIEDTDYTLDEMKERLRPRGHAARRRRHQAGQGQARRRGQGRDHPQDGRRDGQGPAGPGDQAGRPAAQHADPDLPAPAQAGAEGQGDAGDPRPAGPPPRYEHRSSGSWRISPSARSYPKRYEEINRLIGEHQPQREALLRQVTRKVQVDLKAAKIKAETTGRPKHLYSIYQKMIVRGPRLQRHLRPGRGPDPGRHGARLLRGARA